MEFIQQAPGLTNTYDSDRLLVSSLDRELPPDVGEAIVPHLREAGERAVTDWLRWSSEAEATPPRLLSHDPWGNRVDELVLSDGWTRLERAAVQEGIVACAYERHYGEWSRVYQAALLYLFHPSSAFVSCPLAMSDGAARAIELHGDEELKAGAFRRLISRVPGQAWISGQWMTERAGGSDVSGTETVARRYPSVDGFDWTLHGTKWFASAAHAPMAMLLARPEGATGGNRGLGLFYTETFNSPGRWRNIEVSRLKEKMGTKALPTAELRLLGTPARLVGKEGQGVRNIASLFNVTRVYNSICSVAQARRALDLAWAYSKVRSAFGRRLSDHPLHRNVLLGLESEFAKGFRLAFFVARLLGRDECGTALSDERILLRALTPVVKSWTARMCVSVCSEAVEIFGGAGYIEDVGVARLLRDAQVFPIWEGTTNVLALDFMRALGREEAGPVLFEFLGAMDDASVMTRSLLGEAKALLEAPTERIEAQARRLSSIVAELVAERLRIEESVKV